MYTRKIYAILDLVLVTVFLFTLVPLPVSAQSSDPDPVGDDPAATPRIYLPLIGSTGADATAFDALTQELLALEAFRTVNYAADSPVTFDAAAAQAAGFSEESIELAAQMAAFSNDIYLAQKKLARAGVITPQADEFAGVTPDAYPKLQLFFTQAATASTESKVEASLSACDLSNQCTCGWYTWPRPSSAKNRVYFTVSNAEQTLRSWGYHPPLALETEGWTRARTWQSRCGYDTYRDNAAPTSTTRLWEQNYSGWSPNGEPNPEVYRSGPWPYTDWPAYVYWWHSTY